MEVYERFDFGRVGKSKVERLIKRAPVIDLTLEEMNSSIIIESGTNELLERIALSSLLACKGEKTASAEELGQKMVKRWYKGYGEMLEPEVKPVTDKLWYHYDYGDGWIVEITRVEDCDDLIGSGAITEEDLAEALSTVLGAHRPVCIHQDGMRLVDDVGGFGGFVNMLRILYETDAQDEPSDPDDPDTKENTSNWAAYMGWSARKTSNRQML